VLVALCALACLVFAAGSALGAGGLKYASKQSNVSNAEPGRTNATAKCPGTKHPTGGGVEVNGSDLELEVGSTLPTGGHDGWRGGANNSSTSSTQMTTTAICGGGAYVYKTAKKKVAVGHAEQKKTGCPKGTRVVGGGVGAAGDHGVEVGATKPADGGDKDSKADDAWLGRESNSSSKRTVMKVTAVCARRGQFAYVRGSRAVVPNNTQGSVSASCPASTQVTGGGIDVSGKSTDIEVGDSFPSDNGDPGTTPDNGWTATGNNDGSGASTHARAFAICLK
jgi:hypothetical protein